ncbi:MAG: ATP-binding protein [bacterium]
MNRNSQVANELAVGVAKQKLRDVIQEKNSELVRKNQELEQASIQLLQSEKMASIGQLAAGVAHEINNPMGYVNSNLNLLKTYRKELNQLITEYRNLCRKVDEEAGLEELKKANEKIREIEESLQLEEMLKDLEDMIAESIEGTERVSYIVKNLKEFSHPESRTTQKTDIHEALDSTLNIVWNELKYKAQVVKEYGSLPMIECYPQELKQVFMNILVNASQAITERGKITLRTFQKDGFANVQIEDDGEGIEPDALPKIFDPFYTSKEVGKGTGLGLSISYSIMQKHGGSIEIESTPGEGSTFTLKLPLSQDDKMTQLPEKEQEHELGSASNY